MHLGSPSSKRYSAGYFDALEQPAGIVFVWKKNKLGFVPILIILLQSDPHHSRIQIFHLLEIVANDRFFDMFYQKLQKYTQIYEIIMYQDIKNSFQYHLTHVLAVIFS